MGMKRWPRMIQAQAGRCMSRIVRWFRDAGQAVKAQVRLHEYMPDCHAAVARPQPRCRIGPAGCPAKGDAGDAKVRTAAATTIPALVPRPPRDAGAAAAARDRAL